MYKLAVFPGSFDPITIGHYSIINRALPLFDKIIIAVGYNREKNGFFPIEDRIKWINKLFINHPSIEVQSYTGLTVDFCKKVNARYLIRGLRTSADFEFERSVAQVNRKLQ
nr:pantetheine-phosphate adenylyltransferase [Bacteroidales bacterium]